MSTVTMVPGGYSGGKPQIHIVVESPGLEKHETWAPGEDSTCRAFSFVAVTFQIPRRGELRNLVHNKEVVIRDFRVRPELT
jgi:hypothetical protein